MAALFGIGKPPTNSFFFLEIVINEQVNWAKGSKGLAMLPPLSYLL